MDKVIFNLRTQDVYLKINVLSQIRNYIEENHATTFQVNMLLSVITWNLGSSKVILAQNALNACIIVFDYLENTYEDHRPFLKSVISMAPEIFKFLGNADEALRTTGTLVLQHIFVFLESPLEIQSLILRNLKSSNWRIREQLLLTIHECVIRLGGDFSLSIIEMCLGQLIAMANDALGSVREASQKLLGALYDIDPCVKDQIVGSKLPKSLINSLLRSFLDTEQLGVEGVGIDPKDPQITSETELKKEVHKIVQNLSDDKRRNWESKVQQLKAIQSLVVRSVSVRNAMVHFGVLGQHLAKLLDEIRSALIDEVTRTLMMISWEFKEKAASLMEQLMPNLLKLLSNSNQILVDYGEKCTEAILRSSWPNCVSTILNMIAKSKNVQMRVKCIQLVDLMICESPKGYVEAWESSLIQTVKKEMCEADLNARSNARKCFKSMLIRWPDKLNQLVAGLESNVVSMLKKEGVLNVNGGVGASKVSIHQGTDSIDANRRVGHDFVQCHADRADTDDIGIAEQAVSDLAMNEPLEAMDAARINSVGDGGISTVKSSVGISKCGTQQQKGVRASATALSGNQSHSSSNGPQRVLRVNSSALLANEAMAVPQRKAVSIKTPASNSLRGGNAKNRAQRIVAPNGVGNGNDMKSRILKHCEKKMTVGSFSSSMDAIDGAMDEGGMGWWTKTMDVEMDVEMGQLGRLDAILRKCRSSGCGNICFAIHDLYLFLKNGASVHVVAGSSSHLNRLVGILADRITDRNPIISSTSIECILCLIPVCCDQLDAYVDRLYLPMVDVAFDGSKGDDTMLLALSCLQRSCEAGMGIRLFEGILGSLGSAEGSVLCARIRGLNFVAPFVKEYFGSPSVMESFFASFFSVIQWNSSEDLAELVCGFLNRLYSFLGDSMLRALSNQTELIKRLNFGVVGTPSDAAVFDTLNQCICANEENADLSTPKKTLAEDDDALPNILVSVMELPDSVCEPVPLKGIERSISTPQFEYKKKPADNFPVAKKLFSTPPSTIEHNLKRDESKSPFLDESHKNPPFRSDDSQSHTDHCIWQDDPKNESHSIQNSTVTCNLNDDSIQNSTVTYDLNDDSIQNSTVTCNLNNDSIQNSTVTYDLDNIGGLISLLGDLSNELSNKHIEWLVKLKNCLTTLTDDQIINVLNSHPLIPTVEYLLGSNSANSKYIRFNTVSLIVSLMYRLGDEFTPHFEMLPIRQKKLIGASYTRYRNTFTSKS